VRGMLHAGEREKNDVGAVAPHLLLLLLLLLLLNVYRPTHAPKNRGGWKRVPAEIPTDEADHKATEGRQRTSKFASGETTARVEIILSRPRGTHLCTRVTALLYGDCAPTLPEAAAAGARV